MFSQNAPWTDSLIIDESSKKSRFSILLRYNDYREVPFIVAINLRIFITCRYHYRTDLARYTSFRPEVNTGDLLQKQLVLLRVDTPAISATVFVSWKMC
jgi:hypothetical protein